MNASIIKIPGEQRPGMPGVVRTMPLESPASPTSSTSQVSSSAPGSNLSPVSSGTTGTAVSPEAPQSFRAKLLKEEKVHIYSEDFSIFYGSNEAIKKVSLQIPAGKVTAIIGPSGCGKSTYLRAINRMNDLIPGCYTRGKLVFDGEEVYGSLVDPVLLRKRIGMVFQKPNPFPKTIFDNVAFGPRLYNRRSRSELFTIVEKSLKSAAVWEEVKDRLEDNALSLSGGQQQRLCIARALAVEPEILLMDEPTSALDPRATARIEDLVGELRGKYTIIIVTHNMQQAARISDYTAFFYEGDLIEFAPTGQLFTKPRAKKTEEYITGRFG